MKKKIKAVYDRISKNQNVVRCLRCVNWNFKDDGFMCIVCVRACGCTFKPVFTSGECLDKSVQIFLASFGK